MPHRRRDSGPTSDTHRPLDTEATFTALVNEGYNTIVQYRNETGNSSVDSQNSDTSDPDTSTTEGSEEDLDERTDDPIQDYLRDAQREARLQQLWVECRRLRDLFRVHNAVPLLAESVISARQALYFSGMLLVLLWRYTVYMAIVIAMLYGSIQAATTLCIKDNNIATISRFASSLFGLPDICHEMALAVQMEHQQVMRHFNTTAEAVSKLTPLVEQLEFIDSVGIPIEYNLSRLTAHLETEHKSFVNDQLLLDNAKQLQHLGSRVDDLAETFRLSESYQRQRLLNGIRLLSTQATALTQHDQGVSYLNYLFECVVHMVMPGNFGQSRHGMFVVSHAQFIRNIAPHIHSVVELGNTLVTVLTDIKERLLRLENVFLSEPDDWSSNCPTPSQSGLIPFRKLWPWHSTSQLSSTLPAYCYQNREQHTARVRATLHSATWLLDVVSEARTQHAKIHRSLVLLASHLDNQLNCASSSKYLGGDRNAQTPTTPIDHAGGLVVAHGELSFPHLLHLSPTNARIAVTDIAIQLVGLQKHLEKEELMMRERQTRAFDRKYGQKSQRESDDPFAK